MDDIKPATGNERTGYPTQKPIKLLQRIIKASTNEGDIVLDPFCGCATTMVTAQQLERKWIGIDIEDKAAELVVERLSDDAKPMFKDFVRMNTPPERTDVSKVDISKPQIKDDLYLIQRKCCNGCYDNFRIWQLEMDHILPKARGGQDTIGNIQLLCSNCNRIKYTNSMDYLRRKIKERQSKIQTLTFGIGS